MLGAAFHLILASHQTNIAICIAIEINIMRTVQMTLDDELIKNVDRAVKQLNTTRSAFTREALSAALERVKVKVLEKKHRAGYEKKPVENDEFSIWENEQTWGD